MTKNIEKVMGNKKIFELPVYSMKESEFNSKWKERKDELYNSFISHGHTHKSACDGLYLFFPEDIWKYNQIIGYIVISVNSRDVIFDLFLTTDKNIHAVSRTKHFIMDTKVNGLHFYAKNKNDRVIHTEIRKWLSMIYKEYLTPRMYVDYSTFNNLFECVDIKKIMNSENDS